MKQVPELHHCPDCHYQLQAGDGPHGLAWHGCGLWPAQARGEQEDEQPGVLQLVLQAAASSDLTPQGVALAYARVLLYNMATSGDVVGHPGDVFAGIGKFAEASPNDDGGLKGLMELLKQDG